MRYLMAIALMVICFAASSQDLQNTVVAKFNQYKQQHQSFKTAIVFSQEKYVPGDTAFFSAWFMTEAGQFVGGEQILNLDMIDAEGKVVQHILFRVRDGVGSNQLIIDQNTPQGSYAMSVYNEAMNDDDPAYAFRKNILVVKRNRIAARNIEKQGEQQTIEVDVSPAGNLNVTARIPGYRGQDMVLVVTSGGQLYFTAAFKLTKNDAVAIRLPQKDLPEGWILLSIIAKDGTIAATRNFYIEPSIRCTIELVHDTIHTRQEIFSEIKITDGSGKPLSVPLTVSVLNGNIALAGDDHEMNEPPKVPWLDVLAGKMPAGSNPPRLITMVGEAYFTDSDKPVPPSTIVTAFMKKNRFAFEADIVTNGRVELVFLDFFADDEMFYYTELDGKELKNTKIRWITKSIKHAPSPKTDESEQPDSYALFIEKKRVIDRSFNFFSTTSSDSTKTAMIPLEMEFENVGTVVNLNEYKIFPTMAETMSEILPRLSQHRVGNEDIVKVNLSGIDSKGMSLKVNGSPLFIIDGALTKDSQYFLTLDPADVVSVRVVYDDEGLRKFLPGSKNGVVVVKTKRGSVKRPVKSEVLPINGLSAPISFVPAKGAKPEFRSTIAWKPLVKTDSNGRAAFNFMNSDDTGKIKIKVTGVYAGQLFTAEKEVVVTFNVSN